MMQIAMFVTLGLLVFPSHLVPVVGTGLLIAGCLIFVARPVSVFLCLAMSRWSVRERAFISWVGLRGAVPVILATYPLLAGVERAEFIFNAVFFVVLTSSVLQGTTLPFVARRLGVEAAPPPA
jgi:cell volume regulation protein A